MAQYKNIDIIPDSTVNRIHLSQGDVGRTLIFYLFENALSWSVPASSTIKCQGTKPSGFGFSVSCTYSGNTVTCVTTDEMTDEYGQIEAELVITSSDESQVFGTSNFILDIEKNPHPDNTTDGNAETAIALTARITALESAVGDIDDLETAANNLVEAINEVANHSAGGQPVAVTLASDMTDTDTIYLYLGDEEGYDYGYLYVYLSDEWTKTNLYGKGQDGTSGADGYSPTATVTQTQTGATISITDENGTTSASVTNGTATDAQVETYVEAWLDEHPEATTTVTDGSITEAKLSDDVSKQVYGYKKAYKTDWSFTLTAGTTLNNTRITGLNEGSVNGYTTYLIPNANIPTSDGFTKVSGNHYWIGYYKDNNGTRTYTNYNGFLYAQDTYTGIAISCGSSNALSSFVFVYRIGVITTKKSESELVGFSGYETDEYLEFVGNGDSRPIVCLKVETDKVYAIKFNGFEFYQMRASKNTISTFSPLTNATYAQMGSYVLIASVDGYLSWTLGNTNAVENYYASDGLEIFVLDKPEEIQLLRKTVPCRPVVHGGNFKHKVLLAYALGWRGVECDVHKTLDGVYVCSHENNIGGLSIQTNNYSAIKLAYPAVMTVDELIDFSALFGCVIDYHFPNTTDISETERWTLLLKAIQKDIDHPGYYTGINGNIGTISAGEFFNNGTVYGYGDGLDIPQTVFGALHYIGPTGGNVTNNPQIAYVLPSAELGSNTPIKTSDLKTTYANYFVCIAYFIRSYPLYDAKCESLTFDTYSLSFTSSGTKKIYPSVNPVFCSENITWTSSDTSVATVAESTNNNTLMLYPFANVSAVGNGTCTITATVGNVSATCQVTVSGM